MDFNNTAWCLNCHTPLDKVRDRGKCYCPNCREYAKLDEERLKRMFEEDTIWSGAVAKLASGVIEDFMKEYNHHMDLLLLNPFDTHRQDLVRKDEEYINSIDFDILTMGTIDPKKVIKHSRNEILAMRKEKQENYINEKVRAILKEKGVE